MSGGFMSAEITSACRAEDARPWGTTAEERGSLGTLSWPRAAKIAGLAGAVAALTAMGPAAGPARPGAHRFGGFPAAGARLGAVSRPPRAPGPGGTRRSLATGLIDA